MKTRTMPGRQTIEINTSSDGTILICQGYSSDGGYEDTVEILPQEIDIFIEMLRDASKEISDQKERL